MVRVVSQNFSPPRSRHSSGETDRDLAERANLALSTLGRKRLDVPDYESSSDSFWDSEFDGDHYDTLVSENGENSNDINGNEAPEKSDVQSKRKERRRERNKLSAQAYRQRRRSQHVKEQQTLLQLEMENKRLHKIVESLEKKTEEAKQYLRGCSVGMPDILLPIGEVEGACADTDDLPSPCPNVNEVGDHQSAAASKHDSQIAPHPDHTLSPSTFDPTLPHPFSTNGNAQSMTLLTTSNQPSPAVSPVPPTQFVFNANNFIGTTFSPSAATKISTVPTFLAVPLENQNQIPVNANLKCNPLRTCPPGSFPTTDSCGPASLGATASSAHAHDATPVVGAMWWNVNGNPILPSRNPGGGAVLVKCNNNNINSKFVNSSDANGNKSCDGNINMQSKPTSQLMSFNLNLNQTPVTTAHQGGSLQEICQASSKQQVSIQYFLTPNDQAKSVSVQ